MINTPKTIFIMAVFYIVVFQAGCGSAPVHVSEKQALATDLNIKAQAEFKKGNYARAASLYTEALRINRSLDNADGAAAELINLSQTYRKMSETDKAHRTLDELLDAGLKPHDKQYGVEAAFLKSLVYLDVKDHEKAGEWADSASARCKENACEASGKIINLKARIALMKKDYKASAFYASEALVLNRSKNNAEETANSLRTLAESRLAAGAYAEARKLFEEALALDKAAGSSAKIKADLSGIGNSYCAQGRRDAGLGFLERALAVSEASGDGAGNNEIKQLLKQCSTGSGKN
ncbi:MAG: tetratricopeptide repeat protein [Nitrospirae bacterium]|nr:MAG: tetratricopeptide repeat protein [Nitrospirota bacterium]